MGGAMIGDKLGDVRGQNISTRVLPDEGFGPRMEITDQGVGALCGVQVTSTVTYIATMRPDGTLHGRANGIVMSAEGEAATFTAEGVGHFTRPGATRWVGSLFYESNT